LFPTVLDRIVALFIPSEPLSLSLVAIGFAGILCFAAFMLILSEIVAGVRRLAGSEAGSLVPT
jgi:hypothetical protein